MLKSLRLAIRQVTHLGKDLAIMARFPAVPGERAGDASAISWNEFGKRFTELGFKKTDIEAMSKSLPAVEDMGLAFRLHQARVAGDQVRIFSVGEFEQIDKLPVGRLRLDGGTEPALEVTPIEHNTWQRTCVPMSLDWRAVSWNHRVLAWNETVYIRRSLKLPAMDQHLSLYIDEGWTYFNACHRVCRRGSGELEYERRLLNGNWAPWTLGQRQMSQRVMPIIEQLQLEGTKEGMNVTLTSPAGWPLSPVEPELTADWHHVLPGLRVRHHIQGGEIDIYQPIEFQTWQAAEFAPSPYVGSSGGTWSRSIVHRDTPDWTAIDTAGAYECRRVPGTLIGRGSTRIEFRLAAKQKQRARLA
jgi:hypothetical protein